MFEFSVCGETLYLNREEQFVCDLININPRFILVYFKILLFRLPKKLYELELLKIMFILS